MPSRGSATSWAWIAAALAAMACEGDPAGTTTLPPIEERPDGSLSCRFSPDALSSGGVARGGIPALLNPPLVSRTHPDAAYIEEYVALAENDIRAVEARVVGLMIDETAVAVPFNILWWHEVVNLDLGGRRIAVTYCPLTGSALAFDVTAAGASRFGVSGLVFQSNLVMFDEVTESLWPQMCLSAADGPLAGRTLSPVAAIDMTWEAWQARHPETLVVGSQTGHDFEYARYPYPSYEDSELLFFPLLDEEPDPRRPVKERVLGVPGSRGGIAFPFAEMASAGSRLALPTVIDGEVVVVLWDASASTAAAYLPRTIEGTPVTLTPDGEGFVDRESGSRFDVQGRALSGPLAGSTLEARASAYVAYWFAWAAFHPGTRLWLGE